MDALAKEAPYFNWLAAEDNDSIMAAGD